MEKISYDQVAVPFLILGAGPRQKFVYRAGVLRDLKTQAIVREWPVASETIRGDAVSVEIVTTTGASLSIHENAAGIYIQEGADKHFFCGEDGVHFPDFAGHPHARRLRQLHHEIMVNIVEGKPVPNLFVYRTPWLRDSAMMAMCLEKTGNLALLEDWIRNLSYFYDRNNGGSEESDNLGQILYLISLVSDVNHPLVPRVLEEARKRTIDGHLTGMTDFGAHLVYQTKWLKFGLRSLGLDDSAWKIPAVYDSYGALFWWAFTDEHVSGPTFDINQTSPWPYLAWAEAHFHKQPPLFDLLGQTAPITWEAKASQADYDKVVLGGENPADRCSHSHTWHAAEAFLYLLELK